MQEELERIKKILERAKAKAEGRLDLSGLLTEDNPDGCKIFGYSFGGLECVGHSFAYVAHVWFMMGVCSAAVASRRCQLSHPSP